MSVLRRLSPRKADIDRAIKSAMGLGLTVTSIRIAHNGDVEVLTGAPQVAQPDELEAWRAARAGRKAQGPQ